MIMRQRLVARKWGVELIYSLADGARFEPADPLRDFGFQAQPNGDLALEQTIKKDKETR